MINQLPKWIELGAALLAFIAGFINAVGLLSFEHQSVSHLSGTVTLIGIAAQDVNFTSLLKLIGIIFTFVLGAVVAGIFIDSRDLKLGRHYDTLLFFEGTLILLAIYFLDNNMMWGQMSLSMACGIQNAMATRYSGAIIRTTHLTGIFTDIGIMIGSYLKGEEFDRRKFWLFFLIVFGFIVGGIIAAPLFTFMYYQSLYLPFVLCISLAFLYRFKSHSLA